MVTGGLPVSKAMRRRKVIRDTGVKWDLMMDTGERNKSPVSLKGNLHPLYCNGGVPGAE